MSPRLHWKKNDAALGLLYLAIAAGCGSDPSLPPPPIDGDQSPGTSSTDMMDMTSTTDGGKSPLGTDSSSDGASSTSMELDGTTDDIEPDMGPDEPPPPPPPPLACSSVDLLFVVDSSTDMEGYQDQLAMSVPAFVDDLADVLAPIDDFHIGVVTTNEYDWNQSECTEAAALVTHTGAPGEGRIACGPFHEGRYLTGSTGIASDFECITKVGSHGPDQELPMMTLGEVMGGVPGCNDGFLRDDSLLVVVLLTDEADGPDDPESTQHPPPPWPLTSPGNPPEWHDDLVAARGGLEQNIVVLSLIHTVGGSCDPYDIWPVETFGMRPAQLHDGQNIEQFTERFTYGLVGGICENYVPYFIDTVDMVEQACIGYTAPVE